MLNKHELSEEVQFSDDTKYMTIIDEIIDVGKDSDLILEPIRVENAGSVVASVRDELGISQSFVAKRLNRKQPQVSAWEKSDSEIKLNQVFELAAAMGVEPIALILKIFSEGSTATIVKDLPIGRYQALAKIVKRDIYNQAQKKKKEETLKEKLWV